MTRRFFHIGFNFKDRDPPRGAIEKVLDKALDWVRYAPNCYLIYTSRDEDSWYARLRDVIDGEDNIFVVEVNVANRAGWLPRSVWNWINKDRD